MVIRNEFTTISNGDQLNEGYFNGIIPSSVFWWLSSGSGGDYTLSSGTDTIDETFSLTEWDTVTIASGATLNATTGVIRCKNLIINGTLKVDANNSISGPVQPSVAVGAKGGDGGNSGSSGGILFIFAKTITGSGAIDASGSDATNGGNGSTGTSGHTQAGVSGTNGSSLIWFGDDKNGDGIGGTGGQFSNSTFAPSRAGGAAVASTLSVITPTSIVNQLLSVTLPSFTMCSAGTGGAGASIKNNSECGASGAGGGAGASIYGNKGGAGGTSGECSWTNHVDDAAAASGGGGGGGGSGGLLFIVTAKNSFTGSIDISGGNGGNGGNGDTRYFTSQVGGGGGGGGGGAGGLLFTLADTPFSTVTLNGGTGGTGGTSSARNGTSGTNNPGVDGSDGEQIFVGFN